jgi:arsenite methyltransferase
VREAVLKEGLNDVAAASAFGTNHRVGASELSELLGRAGFEDVRVTAHTVVDEVSGVDDAFAWSKSSSFGNFLSDLAPAQVSRVRDRVAALLETLRTPAGIRLERYLVFSLARKP